MAFYIIPQRYKVRGATAEELASRNEVLLERELCYETDTGLGKLGDGETPWNDLPYISFGYIDLSEIQDGQTLVWDDYQNQFVPGTASGGSSEARITAVFDGGGVPIVVGSIAQVYVDYDCTLTGWTLLCDQSGSIQIDVWADTYGNHPPSDADSITGSSPIAVVGGMKAQDITLGDWDTSILAGTVLYFNVDSVTDVERASILLRGTKS